jgi:acetyltransferase-like isoleucine patch superfamily enzyme
MSRLKRYTRMLVTQTYWRLRFRQLGSRTVMFPPLLVTNPNRITIGSGTQIRDFARIEVIARQDVSWTSDLRIGSKVLIEQGAHIICQGTLTIGDGVAIAPYCVILDSFHPNDPPDGSPPIGYRLPDVPTFISIGDGTLIGAHSVIMPNVRIGKYCVIGANSVVTRDIPDYTTAVGSPARAIAVYDHQAGSWKKLPRASNHPPAD